MDISGDLHRFPKEYNQTLVDTYTEYIAIVKAKQAS